MERFEAPLLVAARILLGYFFVWEGRLKIANHRAVEEYMEAYGLPGALLPLVVLTEIAGGLLVVLCLFTRLAALAMAGFALAAALVFHTGFGDAMQAGSKRPGNDFGLFRRWVLKALRPTPVLLRAGNWSGRR